jgi:peptide-methionine (S)-S-oxide reductase
MFSSARTRLVTAATALADRPQAIIPRGNHLVLDRPMVGPYPDSTAVIHLGMGCFWGAERLYWQLPGVYVTAVGYGGGYTANPSYQDVCSGSTAHTELVRVVYHPQELSLAALLKVFWESHDPTQGMRQGNDIGTQYRSALYCTSDHQLLAAEASRAQYQGELARAGYGAITTEIRGAVPFYFAEDYHQQYLAKNPGGYCGLAGTGVSCSGP